MARLRGKVALITGGARGQGAVEARLFAAEGARIVIGDILDDDGELLAKELGDAASYVHHDVTSEVAWTHAVTHTTDRYGRLDVLVNNAGIFRQTPLATSSVEDYLAVVQVNQLGAFLGMKAVIPAMTNAGGGSIVNISSVAGLRGAPNSVAYSASKWAVRGMTKVAALELAPLHIRVNSLHPGFVETDMLDDLAIRDDETKTAVASRIPVGAMSGPNDVAQLALFLAADESRHCTGSEFVVDGGLSAGLGLVQPR